MGKKERPFLTATIPLLLLLISTPGPARGQSIEGFGDNFTPTAVSADGSVVVGYRSVNGDQQAARWTVEGGIQTIVDPFDGIERTTAADVSADGKVVVGSTTFEYEASEDTQVRNKAWMWTEDGGLVYLPVPALGGDTELYSYYAHAIGAHGGNVTIVGVAGFTSPEGDLDTQFVRWVNGGPAQVMGDGNPSDVSQDGSVVVGNAVSETDVGYDAIVWVNGARTVIEDASDEGLAVSADGRFVVGYDRPSASPARWTIQDEKLLLGPEWQGTAQSVSGDGSVVVGRARKDAQQPGLFLWREADGLRLLRDVLEEDYGMDLSASPDFDFTPHALVSADGNVIVGRAYPSQESWLVQLCGIPVAWENASGGLFSDSTNWANKVVPDSLRNALFDTQGSYSVTIDSDVENNALEVRDGTDLTLGTGSNTYTLSGECRAPSAVVESAFLELEEGKVEAEHAVLVYQDEPVLKVSGGAHLVVDSDEDGTGCLIAEGDGGSEALIAVADGGKVESHACTLLGDPEGTAGRLVVDGSGEFATDTLVVGGYGTGAVEIPGVGGRVGANQLWMAVGEGSTASITVAEVGILHFLDSAYVGMRGEAELRVTNTGIVGGGNPGIEGLSLLVLGQESSGIGRLIIEDNGFSGNSDAIVGLDGGGLVQVRSEGSASIRRIWIGGHLEGTIGTGLVTVEGAGSRLEARRIWVGRGVHGILSASDGGLVQADRITLYGYGITTTETGGTIRAPILQVGGAPPAAPKWAAMAATQQNMADEQGVITDTLLIMGDGAVLEVDTFLFNPGGVIGGSGTFHSSLTNKGVISPGDSAAAAGTFAIAGPYTQASTGILEIDLGGTEAGEYDVLSVTGQATLGGTLRLRLTGGYVPEVGDAFEIVRAGSITGAFEMVELPEGIVANVAYGEKTVTVTVSEVTATSNEDPVEELPQAFTLDQNRPNPFGGETTIHFTLPEPADVRLVVYDLLGREMARLVEGRLSAGYHEVTWSSSDLPSGVYLYRLDAGSFSQTRRMVVVR